MSYSKPETKNVSRVPVSAIHEPKGLGLLVALATVQGFVTLSIFARLVMWSDYSVANLLPDNSLTSVFVNTAVFKTAIGQFSVGDISMWVERITLIAMSLALAVFAMKMRNKKQ